MGIQKFNEFTSVNESGGLYVVETTQGNWNCTGTSLVKDGHLILNTIKDGDVKIPLSEIIKIYA